MKTIEAKTPNFMNLLQENIAHEHRVKLIELYEALKEIEYAGMVRTTFKIRIFNIKRSY